MAPVRPFSIAQKVVCTHKHTQKIIFISHARRLRELSIVPSFVGVAKVDRLQWLASPCDGHIIGNGRESPSSGLVKLGEMSGNITQSFVVVLATLESNQWAQSKRERAKERDYILLSATNCTPCKGETAGCQKKKKKILLPI